MEGQREIYTSLIILKELAGTDSNILTQKE